MADLEYRSEEDMLSIMADLEERIMQLDGDEPLLSEEDQEEQVGTIINLL